MIDDIKKAKDMVEHILDKYPDTRDNDKLLWLAYLSLFRNLHEVIGRDAYLKLKKVIMSPNTCSMESVRRVRQKLQEDGKYVGTKRSLKMKEESIVRSLIKDL